MGILNHMRNSRAETAQVAPGISHTYSQLVFHHELTFVFNYLWEPNTYQFPVFAAKNFPPKTLPSTKHFHIDLGPGGESQRIAGSENLNLGAFDLFYRFRTMTC